MKIDRIKIYKISLPFLMNFSHSLKKGPSANRADNIIVEVIADGGKIKGYGEGAPRRYVTGESRQEAIESLTWLIQGNPFPWELIEVSDLWDFIDRLPDERRINPAICALETALLDALGKTQRRPIIDFFPQEYLGAKIHYGCAIPLAENRELIDLCHRINKLEIKKIKLKMGKNFTKNQEALEIIARIFGADYDLKVDVNGAWDNELAAKHVFLLKKYRVRVVEQPMMPDDPAISQFSGALEDSGILLMADESACSYGDIKKIIRQGYYNMINIRLSKLGGFRRSLRIIEALRKRNLFFQIGCHLGESGILSAAGRALSLLCRDSLYWDGSYDRLLLKKNITREHVSFGLFGEAGPLPGFGLGVEINEKHLIQLSVSPSYSINE